MAEGLVLGLLCRSLLGGVGAGRESCSAGAVSKGTRNPCAGMEEDCAQGDLGHKSDNIIRSCCWLPGQAAQLTPVPPLLAHERAVPAAVPGGLVGSCLWQRRAGGAEERGAELSLPRGSPLPRPCRQRSRRGQRESQGSACSD